MSSRIRKELFKRSGVLNDDNSDTDSNSTASGTTDDNYAAPRRMLSKTKVDQRKDTGGSAINESTSTVKSEVLFNGLCEMDTNMLTSKGVPKPQLITNILKSTREDSAEKKFVPTVRRRKRSRFTHRKSGFKTVDQCRLFNTRIDAVKGALKRGEKISLAERLLLLRSQGLRRCRKGKKPQNLPLSNSKTTTDVSSVESDDSDEEEDSSQEEQVMEMSRLYKPMKIEKNARMATTPNDKLKHPLVNSPPGFWRGQGFRGRSRGRGRPRSRPIFEAISRNVDRDSSTDEDCSNETERMPSTHCSKEHFKEPLQLIEGLNKKIYCGFAQTVSTVSRKYHCMFCSFESISYNSIGVHVSEQHSAFSAPWFKTNAIIKNLNHSNYRRSSLSSDSDSPVKSHTVNSYGSIYCCYIDKCSKRFLNETQFSAHQIIHSYLDIDNSDNAESLQDLSSSARVSSVLMNRALLQRTKTHNTEKPDSLVPPPTIVHCDMEQANNDNSQPQTSVTKNSKPEWILIEPQCHCKLGKCEKEAFESANDLRFHCLSVHKVKNRAEIFFCGYCPYACTDMSQTMIHTAQKHPIKTEKKKKSTSGGEEHHPCLSSPHRRSSRLASNPELVEVDNSNMFTLRGIDAGANLTNITDQSMHKTDFQIVQANKMPTEPSDYSNNSVERDQSSSEKVVDVSTSSDTSDGNIEIQIKTPDNNAEAEETVLNEQEIPVSNKNSQRIEPVNVMDVEPPNDNNETHKTIEIEQNEKEVSIPRKRGRPPKKSNIDNRTPLINKTNNINKKENVTKRTTRQTLEEEKYNKMNCNENDSEVKTAEESQQIKKIIDNSNPLDKPSNTSSADLKSTQELVVKKGDNIEENVDNKEPEDKKDVKDLKEEADNKNDQENESDKTLITPKRRGRKRKQPPECSAEAGKVENEAVPKRRGRSKGLRKETDGLSIDSYSVTSNIKQPLEEMNNTSQHSKNTEDESNDKPSSTRKCTRQSTNLSNDKCTVANNKIAFHKMRKSQENSVKQSDSYRGKKRGRKMLPKKVANSDDIPTPNDSSSNSDSESEVIQEERSELSHSEQVQQEVQKQVDQLKQRLERLKWRNNSSISFQQDDYELENHEIKNENGDQIKSDDLLEASNIIKGDDLEQEVCSPIEESDDGISSTQASMHNSNTNNGNAFQELKDYNNEQSMSPEINRESTALEQEEWNPFDETGNDLLELCEDEESDHDLPLDEDYLKESSVGVPTDVPAEGLDGTNEVWTPEMDVLLLDDRDNVVEQTVFTETEDSQEGELAENSITLSRRASEIESESDLSQSQDDAFSSVLTAVVEENDAGERNVWSQIIEPMKNLLQTVNNDSSSSQSDFYNRDDTENVYPSLTKCVDLHTDGPAFPLADQLSSFRQKLYSSNSNSRSSSPLQTHKRRPLSWGPKCRRKQMASRLKEQHQILYSEHSYSVTPLVVDSSDDEPPKLTQEMHYVADHDGGALKIDNKLNMDCVVVVPDIVKVLLRGY